MEPGVLIHIRDDVIEHLDLFLEDPLLLDRRGGSSTGNGPIEVPSDVDELTFADPQTVEDCVTRRRPDDGFTKACVNGGNRLVGSDPRMRYACFQGFDPRILRLPYCHFRL